jgi:uncharacterized protein YndB with AHSA1/START domain
VFDAARSDVFAAFADPARLARWWGPAGAVNVFETFEFRPGGRWMFVMRLPDGAEHAMRQRFVEIAAPERVVIAHEQEGHDFTLTARLEVLDVARTRLSWTMRFASPGEAARVRTIVLAANEENFDRLAAELRREP